MPQTVCVTVQQNPERSLRRPFLADVNLHEYQAKQLFSRHGIPVPAGQVAASVEAAVQIVAALGADALIAKAQVHSGGRGKAGGVHKVEGVEQLSQVLRKLLGSQLVTSQSGPTGLPVN